MPNRGNTQDQTQTGRQNPGTFSPDDDEAQESDQTTLGADEDTLDSDETTIGRKQRAAQNPVDQTEIESEDDDSDVDEVDDEDDDEDDETEEDASPVGGNL